MSGAAHRADLALFEQKAAELGAAFSAALAHGTHYAELEPAAQHELARHLLDGLRRALFEGDSVALLSAVDHPQAAGAGGLREAMSSARLGTLADTQALLGLMRRTAIAALRPAPGETDEPSMAAARFALVERLAELIAQAAAHDAQRRVAEMQGYALQQTVLNESAAALNEAQSLRELMDAVVRFLAPLDASSATLFMFEDDGHDRPAIVEVAAAWARQQSATVPIGQRFEVGDLPFSSVMLDEQVLIVDDIARAPGIDEYGQKVLRDSGVRGLLSAPLFLRDRMIGRMVVVWHALRRFSFHDARLLRAIGEQSSTVAARISLLEESQHRYDQLGQLRDNLAAQVSVQTAELRKFKALVDNALDGIALLSLDGTVRYANRGFRDMTGYGSRAIGSRLPVFFAPQSAEQVRELQQTLRERGRCVGLYKLQRPDGSGWVGQVGAFVIVDGEGAPVGQTVVVRDVTEEQAQQQRLRIFEALAENAPDGIFVAGSDAQLLSYANPSFRVMVGEPDGLRRDRSVDYLAEMPARLAEMLRNVTEQGSWQGQLSYRRADDSSFTGQASIFTVPGPDGRLPVIAGIVRDISDRLRAEQERLALQDQVIAAQQAALRELSTPIIPLADGVVVMPLIGSMDPDRARQVAETLLYGVSTARAHTAILDITGVPNLDATVAAGLLRAANAVKLLGARVLLTGIRPEVAQTLVGLGLDMSIVVTLATLQSGIAYALSGLSGKGKAAKDSKDSKDSKDAKDSPDTPQQGPAGKGSKYIGGAPGSPSGRKEISDSIELLGNASAGGRRKPA